MKKLLKVALAAFMAVGLTACGPSEGPAEDQVNIGFVTDTGGINDKSFNQTSYKGVQDFYAEAGYENKLEYIESKADADYIPNLSTFAEEHANLIVAAGFKFADAIAEMAKQYPDQKMLVIDVDWLNPEETKNVQQAVFAEHEGSFLVGVVAALKAQELGEKTVGMVIGDDSASMLRFYAGYQQGVWAIDPEMKVLYDNAKAFDNDALGKTLAEKQFAECSVIYHAAGGTGVGVINAAKEATLAGKEKWVIGVDTDQYDVGLYDKDNNKSVILTSMLKRVDVAAYNASKAVADGTFKGGVVRYTLKDNGVGLPENNPNLSEDVLSTVAEYTEKIVKGEITVNPEPVTNKENPNTTYTGK